MYCHCCCQSVHERCVYNYICLFVEESLSRTSIRSFLKHRHCRSCRRVCIWWMLLPFFRVFCAISHWRCFALFALFVKPHHDYDNFLFRLVFGISSTWCWMLLLHKCLKCIRCPLSRSIQPNVVRRPFFVYGDIVSFLFFYISLLFRLRSFVCELRTIRK